MWVFCRISAAPMRSPWRASSLFCASILFPPLGNWCHSSRLWIVPLKPKVNCLLTPGGLYLWSRPSQIAQGSWSYWKNVLNTIFWNIWNVNLVSQNLFNPFTETSRKNRIYSKQKRSQDSAFKQVCLSFESKFQIIFLVGTKIHLPECHVIFLDLILCFFLNLCKEIKLIYHLVVAQHLWYKVKDEEIGELFSLLQMYGSVSVHLSKNLVDYYFNLSHICPFKHLFWYHILKWKYIIFWKY